MRLRNKKTGEIGSLKPYGGEDGRIWVWIDRLSRPEYRYNSLAELNEEWEDYEEPKQWWYIDIAGEVKQGEGNVPEHLIDGMKQIGNYFETKEEAEKAVEKLKAWKRLKDKGFDIESWDTKIGDNYYKTGQIVLNLNNVRDREWDEYDQIMEIKNDLDLLFGGEE